MSPQLRTQLARCVALCSQDLFGRNQHPFRAHGWKARHGHPAKSMTLGLRHVLSAPPPGRCGRAPPGPQCAEDGNTPPAMSLGRLLRRASSKASDLLTLNPGGGSGPPSVLDGEIIYSKNNVCVHPPEGLQGLGEHHPGEPGGGGLGSGLERGGPGSGTWRGRDWGQGPEGELGFQAWERKDWGPEPEVISLVSLITKPQLWEASASLPHLPSLGPSAHLTKRPILWIWGAKCSGPGSKGVTCSGYKTKRAVVACGELCGAVLL